jgi:polyhydroxyalkanoate synthesis regulator phasin
MSDKSDKKRGNLDTARRIWLAGVGAYGRAFTEAQEAIKDVGGGTSRVFDDLVQKGEMIEMAVSAKGKDLMDKARVPDLNMDERIAKMRSRLMRGEEVAADMSDFDARLTAVEGKLDRILDILETQKAPARKPAAKKTTTRKTNTTSKK